MCVELLGGTFHSPNCSLAISQASTHSFLSFCHPDWNRVSGLRAKYIPCGECRQQTPLRGGSSCLVAPLGLSMALQESGLRWKIRQLRGRALPGPGVWFLQGKCAALLGWDPSSTWDTPPASEALGGGEWHHQNQHFSRVAHPRCWDASICTAPGLRSGRRETPSDQKCSGRFPGWPVLCTGWAVGLLREGGPEPHCTAQGLARAPYFSAVLFCGNGIRSSVCWSNGQHPPHARDRTCSPFRKSSFCPQIPIGINISWLLKWTVSVIILTLPKQKRKQKRIWKRQK